MMIEKEVSTFEAKNKLSGLLDEAARGQRIWITKRGKRVALLSSGSGASPLAGKVSLASEFRRIRATSKAGRQTLKELVEESQR
jgi:prevent-host-death family protein